MSGEIITQHGSSVVMSETQSIMAVIERIATNPDADIAKLEKMLDMQERILNRNAKQAFTADLAAMQMQLPRVAEKGSGHNNAKYALLEDINDKVRPTLHQYGFAITYRVSHSGTGINVTTVLSHREGHSEETTIVLPADTSGSKNAVQAVGSTISYGKRYGICALLNISTGDDNDVGYQDEPGQMASKKPEPRKAAQPANTNTGTGMATEKQIGLLRMKLKQSGKAEGEMLAAFEIASLEAMPFSSVNDAITWITQ